MTSETTTRPRFSIVTAVYNVARYLPEFIASIEAQGIAPAALEVIAVDDGSTDDSHEVLQQWARESAHRVEVLRQENAGQGAARNRGITHARGNWVNFADPDDRLDAGYLAAIERFLDAHPDVELVAGRPVLHLEAEDRLLDRHPRWRQYQDGDRVADLEIEPNVFPGSTNVGFYRLDRLRAEGIEFDARIRPNFEDGHFAARYVLSLPRPVVGLVREAAYLYRKRADESSALQRSLADPRRYTTVMELGYLAIIRDALERQGRVPEWLQQVLIYELYWYLVQDEKLSTAAILSDDVTARFHELLGRVLKHLEPAAVGRHAVVRLGPVMADVLAHGRTTDVTGAQADAWHSSTVVRTGVDRAMRLRRMSYRFRGLLPTEEIAIDGVAVEPAFEKTTSLVYFGRPLLLERTLWIPRGGKLEVRLGGEAVRVARRWPAPGRLFPRDASEPVDAAGRPGSVGSAGNTAGPEGLAPASGRLRAAMRPAARTVRGVARRLGFRGGRGWSLSGRVLRLLAALPPARTRFQHAWLFMDRIHDADDNGERLFEYVRRARPDINAWFVLEAGTPDWQRLQRAGTDRLLAHGSWRWKLAMVRADWLLSSHVDVPVYRPRALASTGPATWRFAFLQHGIIKDDLSVWLNRRELQLFVTSTEAELVSVAGDGTAYKFTHKEVRNTGLPRFDRLRELANAVPEADRNLILVAPTWRQWLAAPLHSASQRRQLERAFWESEYVTNWLGLLRAPAITAAAARRGWRLGFMPHPNLQAMLPHLDLPDSVERLAFAGTDVQDLYARTALLVTDYSSVAFNTAYVDRPVVYFQFDRDRMLGGAHVGRAGYFDYERDGFGPVALDLEAAERAILDAIERGPVPAPAYAQRIRATFPVRDGGACARVVAAVEELSRPWRPSPAAGSPPPDGRMDGAEGTGPAA